MVAALRDPAVRGVFDELVEGLEAVQRAERVRRRDDGMARIHDQPIAFVLAELLKGFTGSVNVHDQSRRGRRGSARQPGSSCRSGWRCVP